MNDSEKQCDMIRSVSSLWLPWGKWIFGGPWGAVRRPARRPLSSKMKNNEGLNYSVNWVGEKGKLLGWLAVRSEGKGALRNNSWAAFWVGLHDLGLVRHAETLAIMGVLKLFFQEWLRQSDFIWVVLITPHSALARNRAVGNSKYCSIMKGLIALLCSSACWFLRQWWATICTYESKLMPFRDMPQDELQKRNKT